MKMKREVALLKQEGQFYKETKDDNQCKNKTKQQKTEKGRNVAYGIWVWGTGRGGGEVWEEAGRRIIRTQCHRIQGGK